MGCEPRGVARWAVTGTETRHAGLTVTRTVDSTDDGAVVTLAFSSARADPVLARVVDPLATDESHDAERLTIERLLAPGERVTVTYDSASDSPSAGAAPPRIEAVVPVGDADGGADDSTSESTDGPTSSGLPADALRSDGGDLDLGREEGTPGDSTTVPAVGIVASGDDHGAVVRTVTEARSRGHRVYLTYDDSGETTADIAGAAGAVVVDPPLAEMGCIELRETLVERAEAEGHPGIIVQPVGAPPIDYDRTSAAIEKTEFVTTAVPATWRERADETGTPHVVVAIPAYNAVGTIANVVRTASAYADSVIVVDDGSKDGTGDAAREAGAIVVEHRRNRGYGGALKTAFKEAERVGAAHLVVLDADGQHDPTDVPRMVEAQTETGAEIVVGSRYMPESRTKLPFVRRVGLGVINVLTNLSLGRFRPSDFLRDTQSGFRAYDRDAIETLANDPDIGDRMGASTDIIYHAHRERYQIHEVGTTIRYDVEHSSTLNPLAHGYDLVRNIAYTLTVVHPFKTLGAVGSVLTSVGIGIALEGLAIGAQGQQVPFLRTYAATLVALLGFLFVLLAVDYHTIKSHPYYRRSSD